MQFNNDANRYPWPEVSPAPTVPYNNGQMGPAQGWKEFPTQGTPPPRRPKGRGRRRLLTLLSIVLLVMLIIAAVRVTALASGNDDQLVLKIGDQQQALIDLRQSLPIKRGLVAALVVQEQQEVLNATALRVLVKR